MSASRALILTGGPHPFAETTPLLAALLAGEGCAVVIVEDPDEMAHRLDEGDTDLLVANTLRWRMLDDRFADQRHRFGYSTPPATAAAIHAWVNGGGRLLACHGAPICFDDWPGWGDLLGARWSWGQSEHPPLGEVHLRITAPEHPLVAGLADAVITDECYGFLEHTAPIEALVTAAHGGVDHPLLWERPVGTGRAVVCLLGHGAVSFEHPTHAEILRRSIRHLLASHPVEPIAQEAQ